MVRVGCHEPPTRVEYLLGKWSGIGAHIVLFTTALVVSELAWTGLYSGFRGIRAADVASIARFAFDLSVLILAISVVAMAAASCRRTVGSGIVTALMAFILLAVMTMLPFDMVSPGSSCFVTSSTLSRSSRRSSPTVAIHPSSDLRSSRPSTLSP